MKKLTILVYILGIVLCASFVSAITTDGLIAYYDMDIDENDQVGIHNPTASGCNSIETNGALGNSTRCNFNKITYDMSILPIPADGNFTQVIWVNWTTGPINTGIAGIWALGGGSGAYPTDFNSSTIQWNRDSANDPIITYYGSGHDFTNGCANPSNDCVGLDFNVISLLTWYMIAVTYDSNTNTLTQSGSENGVIAINGNDTLDLVLDKTNGNFYFGGRNDGDSAQLKNIKFDEISLWNRTLSHDELKEIYNGGIPLPLSSYTPTGGVVNVSLQSPADNLTFAGNVNFSYLPVSTNSSLVNCSLFLDGILNLTNSTPANDTINWFFEVDLDNGAYDWSVSCFDAEEHSGNTSNWTITSDNIFPTITPYGPLLNNQTIVWNGTLNTEINFTDDNEIYSINVTYGNGSVYWNVTNYGQDTYNLSITDTIYEVGLLNLTARVCDAHTNNKIKEMKDIKYKDKGIKYIMDKWLWVFDEQWVHIYPDNSNLYDAPHTYKQKDRYVFKFNKKNKPSKYETFIVESSDFIDIAKGQNYKGHLVIPNIQDGYWVDFENEDITKVEITRLSSTKIEIKVYGLKDKDITFNSIGELNCNSQTFNFLNIDPTFQYENYVIVGDDTYLNMSVNLDSVISDELNATVHYNGTDYNAGIDDNFSQLVYAPELNTNDNSTNLSFYWSFYNGVDLYNLSDYGLQQNVSDFFIDDCSMFSTAALNVTFWDEEATTTDIAADATWDIYYSINNITKNLNFQDLATNTSDICIYPNFVSFDANYSIFYEEASYPQRRYYDDSTVLDNQTQQIPLYLLSSSVGIYVRFLTMDSYSNILSGTNIKMERQLSGTWTTIEQEQTDGSGLATFWVNPDEDYRFTFSKTDYDTEVQILRPTSSEIYNVYLGGQAAGDEVSYGAGIIYSFSPSGVLNNNTDYTFNYNLNSSYWDITSCTFELLNGSTVINSSTSSYDINECDIDVDLNTGGYDIITARATYALNDSSSLVHTTLYQVYDTAEGEFSFKSFLDDATAFNDAGFNDFTRIMIAFIIIMLLVGASAMKGLTDVEGSILLIMALVWAFSFLGWLTMSALPTPLGGSFGLGIQRHAIAVVISLIGGGYLLRRHQ